MHARGAEAVGHLLAVLTSVRHEDVLRAARERELGVNQTDRAGAEHGNRVPGVDLELIQPVQATRDRLGQAQRLRIELRARGDEVAAAQRPLGHDHVLLQPAVDGVAEQFEIHAQMLAIGVRGQIGIRDAHARAHARRLRTRVEAIVGATHRVGLDLQEHLPRACGGRILLDQFEVFRSIQLSCKHCHPL